MPKAESYTTPMIPGTNKSLDSSASQRRQAVGMTGHEAVAEGYANEKLALSLVDHILSPIHSR